MNKVILQEILPKSLLDSTYFISVLNVAWRLRWPGRFRFRYETRDPGIEDHRFQTPSYTLIKRDACKIHSPTSTKFSMKLNLRMLLKRRNHPLPLNINIEMACLYIIHRNDSQTKALNLINWIELCTRIYRFPSFK